MDQYLQKSEIRHRLRRGLSRGVFNPRQVFSKLTMHCYVPLPDLAPFVANFWIIRWDSQAYPAPTHRYILTQPAIDLYLSRFVPHIEGITTKPVAITPKGHGLEIGIKFKPGGFYSFYRSDVSQLANHKIPAETVFPEVTETFLGQLYSRPHDDAFIVTQLENLLKANNPQASKPLELIHKIVAAVENGELQTVSNVAEAFTISERMLHYLFTIHVGVGVKWVIMRARLLKAAHHAHTRSHHDWTRIAVDLGYSTQSHFANDFKKHVGLSPSHYLKSIDTNGPMPTL